MNSAQLFMSNYTNQEIDTMFLDKFIKYLIKKQDNTSTSPRYFRYLYDDYDSGTYDEKFKKSCDRFVCKGNIERAILKISEHNILKLYDIDYYKNMFDNIYDNFLKNEEQVFDFCIDSYKYDNYNGFIEITIL